MSSSSKDKEREIKRYASPMKGALLLGPSHSLHVDSLELPRLKSLQHALLFLVNNIPEAHWLHLWKVL
jgi:hypothetical protein